jgi:hypothetical protein
MRPQSLVDDLGKDLTYAARTLRNAPSFTMTALLSIALGIGASTAIFSVINAVLLRPLPYEKPDWLILADAPVSGRIRRFGSDHGFSCCGPSRGWHRGAHRQGSDHD